MTQVTVAPLVALLQIGLVQDSGPRGIGLLGSPGRTYPVTTFADFAIRVDEARFALRYGDRNSFLVARRGSKLLVVRYTLTNREGYAVAYTPNLVRLAVSLQGGRKVAATPPTTSGTTGPREIKAKGTVQETVFFEIPSDARSPRLETRVADGSTIRFDIASFAKPLRDPFIAPDGGTVLDVLEAKPGQRLPLSSFDVTVEKPVWERVVTPSFVPSSKDRVILAVATLHNVAPYPGDVAKGSVVPELVLENGKAVLADYAILAENGDQAPTGSVAPGRSLRVRYAIKVGEGIRPVALRLTDAVNSGRSILVRL